jgi:hypothetical protein
MHTIVLLGYKQNSTEEELFSYLAINRAQDMARIYEGFYSYSSAMIGTSVWQVVLFAELYCQLK